MYSHGYPEWTEKGGIVFKLRTEDLSGPEPCLVVEDCVYDTLEHRAFSKRMQGGASVGSLFTGEALQEIPGSLEEEFSENIAETGTETKQKLLSDYFFTVLPFIVVRLPVDFTLVGTDSVNGVNYFVIDICFECEGYRLPASRFRLYYTCSTWRLNRVFYQPEEGPLEGNHVWCVYDSFAAVDGVLLGLQREFYISESDDNPSPLPGRDEPFCRQWLYDVTLERSLDFEF